MNKKDEICKRVLERATELRGWSLDVHIGAYYPEAMIEEITVLHERIDDLEKKVLEYRCNCPDELPENMWGLSWHCPIHGFNQAKK